MKAQISIKKIEQSCENVSHILKALSHPQRLLILGHLIDHEKTVSELVNVCSISQSQMSQFLIRMKMEGLITCRKEGRFQFYSVANSKLAKLIFSLQNIYCS